MSRTPQVEKQEVGRTWQISCTSASARRDSEDEDGWMGEGHGDEEHSRHSMFRIRPAAALLAVNIHIDVDMDIAHKSQEPHRDGIGLLVMPNPHLKESFAIYSRVGSSLHHLISPPTSSVSSQKYEINPYPCHPPPDGPMWTPAEIFRASRGPPPTPRAADRDAHPQQNHGRLFDLTPKFQPPSQTMNEAEIASTPSSLALSSPCHYLTRHLL